MSKPSVVYTPINPAQRQAAAAWDRAKLLVLLGPAGCGKTACALGMALRDLLAKRVRKVILARPAIPCGEDLGFLPGSLEDKVQPWLAPFLDVLGDLSHSRLGEFVKELGADAIETVSVGMLRGRTVKDAILVVDEAANLSTAQLCCVCTRVGKNGKVVLAGDPSQSDIASSANPFAETARRLSLVDGVEIVRFSHRDQVRDPFVTSVLAALSHPPGKSCPTP